MHCRRRNPPRRAGVDQGVIVDLYSSSFCGACTATRAVLDEAARLVPAATVVERNVAGDPEAAASERIRSTPTVIVRREDGTEVFRAEGVPTVARVLGALALAI